MEPVAKETEPTTQAGRELLSYRGLHGKWTEQRWVDAILAIEAEAAFDSDVVELFAPLQALVDEQAEDEGLWFIAATAPEAYLQQELRRLHATIEGRGGIPEPIWQAWHCRQCIPSTVLPSEWELEQHRQRFHPVPVAPEEEK
jgi:hypothetical protein